jgi:hypothetical protein
MSSWVIHRNGRRIGPPYSTAEVITLWQAHRLCSLDRVRCIDNSGGWTVPAWAEVFAAGYAAPPVRNEQLRAGPVGRRRVTKTVGLGAVTVFLALHWPYCAYAAMVAWLVAEIAEKEISYRVSRRAWRGW